MSLFGALAFLTRLPMHGEFEQAVVGRGSIWFPLVGAVLGAALWLAFGAMRLVLPSLPTKALILVMLALFTGGLHLDGLADTVDGLAAGAREKALEAMRDPRIGALGASAVALVIVTKFAALAAIPDGDLGRVLVVMAAVGRWAPVFAAFRYPYARAEGLGKAVVEHTRAPQIGIATVLTIVVALLLGWRGLSIFLGAAVAAMMLSAYVARRIGGHTGDTYGFLIEITESMALLEAAI